MTNGSISTQSITSFADLQLMKILLVLLQSKGIRINEDALVQLTEKAKQYFHELSNHLQEYTEIQRRKIPILADVQLLFRLNNLKVDSLYQESLNSKIIHEKYRNQLASITQSHIEGANESKNEDIELENQLDVDSLPFFNNEHYDIAELVHSKVGRPDYIPSYLPDLPPDYTYQSTPNYIDTITDLKTLRLNLVNQSRSTEISLNELVDDEQRKWKAKFEQELEELSEVENIMSDYDLESPMHELPDDSIGKCQPANDDEKFDDNNESISKSNADSAIKDNSEANALAEGKLVETQTNSETKEISKDLEIAGNEQPIDDSKSEIVDKDSIAIQVEEPLDDSKTEIGDKDSVLVQVEEPIADQNITSTETKMEEDQQDATVEINTGDPGKDFQSETTVKNDENVVNEVLTTSEEKENTVQDTEEMNPQSTNLLDQAKGNVIRISDVKVSTESIGSPTKVKSTDNEIKTNEILNDKTEEENQDVIEAFAEAQPNEISGSESKINKYETSKADSTNNLSEEMELLEVNESSTLNPLKASTEINQKSNEAEANVTTTTEFTGSHLSNLPETESHADKQTRQENSSNDKKFDIVAYAKLRRKINDRKIQELSLKRQKRQKNIFMQAEKYYSPYCSITVTEEVENKFNSILYKSFKSCIKSIRIEEAYKQERLQEIINKKREQEKEAELERQKSEFVFGFNPNNDYSSSSEDENDEFPDFDFKENKNEVNESPIPQNQTPVPTPLDSKQDSHSINITSMNTEPSNNQDVSMSDDDSDLGLELESIMEEQLKQEKDTQPTNLHTENPESELDDELDYL